MNLVNLGVDVRMVDSELLRDTQPNGMLEPFVLCDHKKHVAS